MLMYCSLQVLQTPLVPNMDERRLRTELPNWCQIERRNKQWHANVCVLVLPWIWSVLTILCLFFWFFLSVFTSVCVHLSFTLIIGRITAVCVQTVHKHIHSCQVLSGWWNLFICRLFACVVVHHVCFTPQWHFTCQLSDHCFSSYTFSSDHQGATESISGSVCLYNNGR